MNPIKSVAHFFAKAYTAIVKDIPKVLATAPTVEQVTSQIPVYGPLALTIEQTGYAALGELSSVLNAGGEAVAAKLSDAGLDIAVINQVKALLSSFPTLATVAKAL